MEARRQATLCIRPRRRTVVVWTWPAARLTGVGDGDVPIVRVAVILISKTLEWRQLGVVDCCPVVVGV